MTEIAILWPMFPGNKHSSFPKEAWQKEVSCSGGVSGVSWWGGYPPPDSRALESHAALWWPVLTGVEGSGFESLHCTSGLPQLLSLRAGCW